MNVADKVCRSLNSWYFCFFYLYLPLIFQFILLFIIPFNDKCDCNVQLVLCLALDFKSHFSVERVVKDVWNGCTVRSFKIDLYDWFKFNIIIYSKISRAQNRHAQNEHAHNCLNWTMNTEQYLNLIWRSVVASL